MAAVPLVVPAFCNLWPPLRVAPVDPLWEAPKAFLPYPEAFPAQDSRAPPLWPDQPAAPGDGCSQVKQTEHTLPGSQISLPLELGSWSSDLPCKSGHLDARAFLHVPPGCSGPPDWEPETLLSQSPKFFLHIFNESHRFLAALRVQLLHPALDLLGQDSQELL